MPQNSLVVVQNYGGALGICENLAYLSLGDSSE